MRAYGIQRSESDGTTHTHALIYTDGTIDARAVVAGAAALSRAGVDSANLEIAEAVIRALTHLVTP